MSLLEYLRRKVFHIGRSQYFLNENPSMLVDLSRYLDEKQPMLGDLGQKSFHVRRPWSVSVENMSMLAELKPKKTTIKLDISELIHQ